jgi:hypothetical protein
MIFRLAVSFVASAFLSVAASAEPVRIVSWNISPSLYETMERRADKIRAMDEELRPDVLVLIEVAGIEEASRVVKALGWQRYHVVVTNWSVLNQNVHFALEAAVISKVPIERAIEYDAVRTDGHHEAFTEAGEVPGLVSEEPLNTTGIKGFGGALRWTDRGTIRVDLANGLTIFPLHLKSNFNSACKSLEDAADGIKKAGLPPYSPVQEHLDNGFAAATAERVSSAQKREQVAAAVVRIAEQIISARERTVLLAGDFNTSFEPGLYGREISDCQLTNFTCRPGPLPPSACPSGDGYDDTIGGILEGGLTGPTKWMLLSRALGRTYRSSKQPDPFADLAIDHFAVPLSSAREFATATKASDTFGSDHFPILTVWNR